MTVTYNTGRRDRPRLVTITGTEDASTATHLTVECQGQRRRIHRSRVRRVEP